MSMDYDGFVVIFEPDLSLREELVLAIKSFDEERLKLTPSVNARSRSSDTKKDKDALAKVVSAAKIKSIDLEEKIATLEDDLKSIGKTVNIKVPLDVLRSLVDSLVTVTPARSSVWVKPKPKAVEVVVSGAVSVADALAFAGSLDLPSEPDDVANPDEPSEPDDVANPDEDLANS